MEFTLGKMEENMLEAMSLIKNMDTVNIIGMMEEFLRGFGRMEREMDKVELFILTGLLKVGFGKTIKESIRVIVKKQLQVINNDIREIIT